MTAVCAFALAVATVARSANAGAAAGVAAWLIIVLSGRVASGHFAAAVTDTVLFLPYLAIGAGCAGSPSTRRGSREEPCDERRDHRLTRWFGRTRPWPG